MDSIYIDLAKKYGTPLYAYNVNMIKSQIEDYLKYFKSDLFDTEISYASKALSIKEIIRIVKSYNLSLDVVSLGECYTAIETGFNPKNIYFHGNNKTIEEIDYLLKNNVGYVVVDSYDDLSNINEEAIKLKKNINVLVRLNLGIDAHTHKYINTSYIDSKFGIIYKCEEFYDIMGLLTKSDNLNFVGFHSHIGSQIFDLSAYEREIDKFIDVIKDYNKRLVINLGGGFGCHYTKEDNPAPIGVAMKRIISYMENKLKENDLSIAKLMIEPGRSIVCEAGSTIYSIGNIKKTPNRLYYFVDGGMADNIRPALYQAKYDAFIPNQSGDEDVTIAGKCCESGDILIDNIKLPLAKKGDILVVKSTGAYGYSMASNYNKLLKPAVVFFDLENKTDKLVCERESLKHIIDGEK